MNFKKIRKFRRNTKAISPIIATLLLIAIAVVAALVTYAWVMGYIGYQTTNAGNSVLVQSTTFSGTSPQEVVNTVYVQNTGTSTVTLNPFVFINGAEVPTTSITVGTNNPVATGTVPLPGGSTATISVSTNAATAVYLTSGQTVTVKVTTTSGTYNQLSQQAP